MSSLIPKVYHRLFKKYGPQGWWPVTPRGKYHPVYQPRKSLKKNSEREKFEICLGALLTQNTSWSNVEKALNKLNQAKSLSFQKITTLPLGTLERLIRSSGYYKQKAERIRHVFKSMGREESVSQSLRGPTKEVRSRLLKIKGIGPETADSMLLYAAGHPIFVVDAYTKRIGSRIGFLREQEKYESVQGRFMRALPRSASLFGEYHALLVQLAKDYCRKKPICGPCPVKKFCKKGRSSH